MSFDSRTNTITLKDDGDFLADSGSFFLKAMKDLWARPGVSPRLAADWATIAEWLDCAGRELNQGDYEKFGLVFRSYLARGVAPSVALEEAFKKFALMAKDEAWPTVAVPQELVPVFKRMMANDGAIQRKRANDVLRFAAALESLKPPAARPARQAESASPITRLNWIPLGASISILLMASADRWPYGFYQLLRLVVTITAVYIVVRTHNHRRYWPWVMGGVAILFNPIVPISFTREEWQPIDFGVAIIFLSALIQALRRRL